MNNNPNQPREFDAVLGGEVPPPASGVILGGIEGVKNRLKSSNFEVKIAALEDAINYGDTGLDLVIEALKNSSEQMHHYIARLLKIKGGEKGKQALLDFDYRLYFTKLENWDIQDFNPELGITNPTNTAYRLRLDWPWRSWETIPKSFELFVEDSHANQVEALLLPFGRTSSCKHCVNTLIESRSKLTNLKALYIGDMHDYEYKTSDVVLSNMSPILEAYPNLEVLQVRGFGDDPGCGLSFSQQQHNKLKTLIVETGYRLDPSLIDTIATLELPALEYLQLWLGKDLYYPFRDYYEEEKSSIDDSALTNLMPIISGKVFPQLKYLGLPSSNYSDAIAEAIVNSPLINKLKVLDLSMGTLTNKGATILMDCPSINQLHTLDISNNLLGISMIQKLSQLKCRVISEPQADSSEYRYYSITE